MGKTNTKKKKVKVAIDAMGGDFAPVNEIQGAIDLFDLDLPVDDLEIVLVGDEQKLNAVLAKVDCSKLNYSVVHADEVITMHDEPTAAIKKKRNSSMYKGIELVKKGHVDAFVSAGNTGAVMATSTVVLGRIKGVSRPTIGTFLPTQNELPTLLVDAGANIDVKPQFLYEFAVMGSIHVKNMLGVENPTVGLLNIGEETTKGNETVQEAYKLLKNSSLNFLGNVEGRDILKGKSHIVVCDGFTGNIILKFAESFVDLLKSKMKEFAKKSIINLGLAGIMKPIMKKILSGLNYEVHGGVPLLGVNGVVIIGHGKSSPLAIKNMLLRSIEMVIYDVNNKIEDALNNNIVNE